MRTVIALRLLAATVLVCGMGIISCGGATEPGTMLNLFSRVEGGVTHFYVHNLQLASVTATLGLRSSNLLASAKFPYTTTLAGKQTLEAFTLTPIQPDVPWRFSVMRSSVIGSATAVHDDSYVYLLPYAPGSSFLVSQGYHGKFSHTGPDEYAIDWRMPVGTPVLAARDGLVVQSKDDMDQGGPNRKFETSANCILIEHSDGTIGIYGHLKQGGNQVKVGDRVKTGDFIGLSGNTGFSNGPHLHFAIFKAKDGMQRVSLPVKFRTDKDTAASLVAGKFYTAPNLARFGLRAARPNENFLNANLFAAAFVSLFESFKQNVGIFIFELSKFYHSDYQHGRDFLPDLDRFLAGIPKSWNYGIEIRTKHFLNPEYFAVLARHGVAHVFNSWADMPPVSEQLALPESITNPNFAGARFLLKPGRKYQESVDLFSPYDKIKEPYPEATAAAAELISRALLKQAIRKLFLYVNNRLEGNALLTIMKMLESVASGQIALRGTDYSPPV